MRKVRTVRPDRPVGFFTNQPKLGFSTKFAISNLEKDRAALRKKD